MTRPSSGSEPPFGEAGRPEERIPGLQCHEERKWTESPGLPYGLAIFGPVGSKLPPEQSPNRPGQVA